MADAFADIPLRHHRTLDTTVLDVSRAAMQRFHPAVHTIEIIGDPAGFRHAAHFVRLGDFRLGITANSPVRVVGSGNVAGLLLVLDRGWWRIGASAISTRDYKPGEGLFIGGDPDMINRVPARAIQVDFDIKRLETRVLAWTGGRALKVVCPTLALDPDRIPAHADLVQVLRASIAFVDQLGTTPATTMGLIGLDEMVLKAVASVYVPGFAQAIKEAARPMAASHVVRARDMMAERATEPIRIADIAAELGVSMRTLQLSFQRDLGLTPTAYLREIRLDRAHELLRSGTPGISVTSVAFDCGFYHLGEFAKAFKARYGVAPSTLLKGER